MHSLIDWFKLVKPERLKSGDRVAIVSLASTPFKENMERGINYLQRFGLEVVVDSKVFDEYGYLAGSDIERANALNNYFADKSIKAIFSSCGGYGSGRILPYIDFSNIERNPKVFVGYSDITSLHLAIQRKTNLITFYGQMPMVDLGKDEYSHILMNFLFDPDFRLYYKGDSVKSFNPMKVEGQLVGGCLTLIDALLGTEYEIDTKGKILFIEEVEEHNHDIDRMLLHLKLTNKLDDAVGFLIGDMVDIKPKDQRRKSLTLEEIFEEYIVKLNKPVLMNFPAGHGKIFVPLPLGVLAQIDSENGTIKTIEGSVI
ncbi:MAG: S66 peptidase family protein [Caldisericum exile]|uniref:S66 peptidase family protein n=1 Tax=Caldisericum exile TaxID=693075 RepID=UPI003C773B7B